MVNNTTNTNKTSNYLSLITEKTTTYDAGNPCPDLGQAHTCGGVKLVTNLPLLLTGYQTTIHI